MIGKRNIPSFNIDLTQYDGCMINSIKTINKQAVIEIIMILVRLLFFE